MGRFVRAGREGFEIAMLAKGEREGESSSSD